MSDRFEFDSEDSNCHPISKPVAPGLSKESSMAFNSEIAISPSPSYDIQIPSNSQQALPPILQTPCHENSSNTLSFVDTDKIIHEFETFLLSMGGGGRGIKPVKGDISSFRCLIRCLGWDHIWEPNLLNSYVTDAVKQTNSSASTIYGRLRVYERFVHFLRIQLPIFLPSPNTLLAIDAMITNLKRINYTPFLTAYWNSKKY